MPKVWQVAPGRGCPDLPEPIPQKLVPAGETQDKWVEVVDRKTFVQHCGSLAIYGLSHQEGTRTTIHHLRPHISGLGFGPVGEDPRDSGVKCLALKVNPPAYGVPCSSENLLRRFDKYLDMNYLSYHGIDTVLIFAISENYPSPIYLLRKILHFAGIPGSS
jgi:hypothetical protein